MARSMTSISVQTHGTWSGGWGRLTLDGGLVVLSSLVETNLKSAESLINATRTTKNNIVADEVNEGKMRLTKIVENTKNSYSDFVCSYLSLQTAVL